MPPVLNKEIAIFPSVFSLKIADTCDLYSPLDTCCNGNNTGAPLFNASSSERERRAIIFFNLS